MSTIRVNTIQNATGQSIIKVDTIQDASGASIIKVDTIKDTSDIEQYTVKCWVNFNGEGTIAIRNDGNVSSLSDRGTGRYSVNLGITMPNVNFVTTDSAAADYISATLSPYSQSVSAPNTTTRAYVDVGNEYEGSQQWQDYAYVGLVASI